MQYIVNSEEMKKYDNNTTSIFGIPGLVLMERAAVAVVEELLHSQTDLSRTLVCCGTGNNGGDGAAVARLLFLEGISVKIVVAGQKSGCSELMQKQLAIAEKYGVSIEYGISEQFEEEAFTTIIDAVFGVGLNRRVEDEQALMVRCMNAKKATRIAIDIPSGIHADTGKVMGKCVKADKTITFSFLKRGLVLFPGAEYAGEIVVKNIGINERSFADNRPGLYTYQRAEFAGLLPNRLMNTHKGSYGKLTLIAGSVGMAGAACLAAEAAYRSGCGLVKIVTPEENRCILQQLIPEAVLVIYHPQTPDMEQIVEAIKSADAVGIGPGLGTGTTATQILKAILKYKDCPVVMDADALNILADNEQLLKLLDRHVIVTPHIGEMARLMETEAEEIMKNTVLHAKLFADEYHAVCVLKSARTIVAESDSQAYINLDGNNGMATAGSGDVLTGIIGGLLAQKMSCKQAAVLGVWMHALAGDEMIKEKGKQGLLARDIITGITRVTRSMDNETV